MILDSAKLGCPNFALSKTFSFGDVNMVAVLFLSSLYCPLSTACLPFRFLAFPLFTYLRHPVLMFRRFRLPLIPYMFRRFTARFSPLAYRSAFPLSVYLRFSTHVILFYCSNAFASFPLHRPIQWRDIWAYALIRETTLSFQVYPVTFYSTIPSAACHCFPCIVLEG